jgi:phage baseplate assembly protein W
MKYLGIRFPLTRRDDEGFIFDLTKDEVDEIKCVIKILLTTPLNQRYRNPEIGCRLLQFIFEQNDGVTMTNIKDEVTNTLVKYIKGLSVNDVEINKSQNNSYSVEITVNYTITDGILTQTDFVVINI